MRYRVLVVDDEQDVLNVLREMLERLGFETCGATSGIRAIELIKRERFDLLIIDLIMPGLGGMDILREIQRINKRIPVLITAGVDLSETNINLTDMGVRSFIKKPFTIKDIKSKINDFESLKEVTSDSG